MTTSTPSSPDTPSGSLTQPGFITQPGPVTRFDGSVTVTSKGKRAIDWLAENTPLSRMQLKKALSAGAVWLQTGKQQERFRRATREPFPNSILHVHFDAAILALVPPAPRLLADEKHYSVWVKPAGLLSQGTLQGDHCSLLRMAEQQLNRKAFLVHRLDREASGLMLVAHNEKAAAALSGLFQNHTIQKFYRTTVQGKVGVAALPFCIDTELDGKTAATWINHTQYDPVTDTTQLEVRIDTGRKHQIRRHLAGIGHPVVGDPRYGNGDKQAAQGTLALEAFRIRYQCPVFNRPRQYDLDDKDDVHNKRDPRDTHQT